MIGHSIFEVNAPAWWLQRIAPPLLAFCCAGWAACEKAPGPAEFVNPLIGTANSGNIFPGAVLPFGMVAFSPEELPADGTHRSLPGGYSYQASEVRGFSLTHLSGAGCPGSGDFVFMPVMGEVRESPALNLRDPQYTSGFKHSDERAAAGYYGVRLDNGVFVELTATQRTGMARLRFPGGKTATLLIRSSDNETFSVGSEVRIDPARRTVSGWLRSGGFCRGGAISDYDGYYTIYFVAHFDRPFQSHGTWKNDAIRPDSESAEGGTAVKGQVPLGDGGKGAGAYVTFGATPDVEVQMRVGISYVSEANAEENLRAESPEGTTFESIRAKATDAWNAALGKIEIHGGMHDQKAVFYTALYHALLHMNLASDVNGEYRGMDQATHHLEGPQSAEYANFSGWDVYRSQVQLVTLLFPKIASDMAQSLLNQANQWGCWSRWTHQTGAANVMNGDPSAPAIAAIEEFGGDEFDVKGAYESLLAAALTPHDGHRCSRPNLQQWLTEHYFTASNTRHDTSVADTLEYSTADFALSQLAGRQSDTANEEKLLQRARYWKSLYNPKATPQEGYLQPRKRDGNWKSFDPASTDGLVEGTGAQYLWMVPFDVRGLFELMGGNEPAIQRLDRFFRDEHGGWAFTADGVHPGFENEPSLGTPWLYDFAGAPSKTQETVRAVLDRLWHDSPDGIPGNDDLGEMSSWYVWAALGMYPEIPGRAELLLTSPLFAETTIHRENGTMRLAARRRIGSDVFIHQVRVNGKRWQRPWLPESFVRLGGTVEFDLSDKPSGWGSKADDAPPSFGER